MNAEPAPHKEVSKAVWRRQADALRARLLNLQYQLRSADFPVLLVFGGVDGAGKHEMANLLTEWLDPRFIRTLAYAHPTRPRPHYPPLLQHWQDLPRRGELAIVLSGWYTPPLLANVRGELSDRGLARALPMLGAFEQDLVADGVLLLKFWMHLDVDAQRQRLTELMADPLTIWQVEPRDWANLHRYEDFMSATRRILASSRRFKLPWQVVNGQYPRARALAVGQSLADALEQRLEQPPRVPRPHATTKETLADRLATLEQPQLDKAAYKKRLLAGQAELHHHSGRLRLQQRSLVLVFEGWDAAGKGGAIRRLLQALDVRFVRVHRIAAPDEVEQAHHYLWRFATRFPQPGQIAIFDRSWYGRMLVERVERLAPAERWQAAAGEIRRFEEQWTQAGHRLVKFWLHITPEEQLARFEARREDPLKDWKLTDEDWRNRDKWPAYAHAANAMFAATDAPHARWHLIGANDKRHARIAVLDAVNTSLAHAD